MNRKKYKYEQKNMFRVLAGKTSFLFNIYQWLFVNMVPIKYGSFIPNIIIFVNYFAKRLFYNYNKKYCYLRSGSRVNTLFSVN